MRKAYILAAYRTPGCKAKKGKFKDMRPDDLAAEAIKGLVERTGVDAKDVEDVIIGCAFPEGEQGMNVARVAAFKAGLPIEVPAMTVNRFCSSGLQTIALAAERIMAGFADCIIAGGTESMTMVPMGGNKFSANPDLIASWPETYASMGITAELVAEKYGISREEQDEFAYTSHMRAAAAIKEGKFKNEIIPVEVEYTSIDEKNKVKKVKEVVDIDDGVRPDTTIEGLAKLKPVFRANGSVTAGNSSQMTDGAAAVLVVSEDYLKKIGGKPLARFVAFAAKGVAPEIMGIGPVAAIPAALKLAGLELKDIGLIELNEAFAAQSLAVIKELGLNREITNVNGGAIALGHPLGCTGAKLTATLLHEMHRRDVKYGMVSMCIGGGMGAAGIFEIVK
ncbi:3-ketoacyl-CoA thiolase [Deferribacter desulfuricans SSM1]|uniref:acetyl-CoA C-acyltransferase n=1 Tax=Deferribacter desulfuricans (strain DSM 14783 / JCM 11476 / NBRC 101012 / SSM1) TaxID=639282 RepID=D3PEA3_DEFDS|nr:thiolase family protein [Deferribacter desulfuricans]BAI80926.1 3-ketoacyl-CoA thiolase [Deferribacter desulfuricans SSM1]